MYPFSFLFLILAGSATPRGADDVPALPPAHVALRIDTGDLAGPWKMVVTNQGTVPVRFAADGRLLSLEVSMPEDPYASAHKGRGSPASRPIVCKLPAELRPTGVADSRAVLLAPGTRYEEVFSPALYCFSEASAKVLVPGTQVTAKLGFSAPPARGKKNTPPSPPFVIEPAMRNPTVSARKELVSEPFVLPAAAPISRPAGNDEPQPEDPNEPNVEVTTQPRVDAQNELTVAMTLTLKNSGARATTLHLRRDNLMFDIDGPSGSARCGAPIEGRTVARDAFLPLDAGASRRIDVWVGEMCPNVVFDRPGLYRIWASVAFPASSEPGTLKVWTKTIMAKEPALVRVREGRLPFYASPPQVFGGALPPSP